MSETPKRRLLRKSALQASPFGAPIKTFSISTTTTAPIPSTSTTPTTTTTDNNSDHNNNNNNNNNNSTSQESIIDSETITPTLSPTEHSPTSRKSARLSALHKSPGEASNYINSSNNNNSNSSSNGNKLKIGTPRKYAPPSTPKSKTILKMGVWGHVVGLKKMDESVYYRYPIDKSYCSFGRSDSNDIRVQIDAVSDMHCKLIRRDDGEVWLKDTSINGTLLNNVLVHDTARPIHHNDVMTIAGRKFRFESFEPVPVTPSTEPTEVSTPTRIINNISKVIDDDLQILAEIPSPTSGRIPSTPKNTARTAAALESSLGLFTPNRAAKLSSLLVSPKPIPLPAFLSKSPMKSSTPRSTLVMINEPSVFNVHSFPDPSSSASDTTAKVAPHTPKQEKRKASSMDFDESIGERTPKKVSFGPALSPEIFDKAEPPSTPVKRGQQQGIMTPRRHGVSTPSLLSKLNALKPTAKPILTPSKLTRTSVMHDLDKPEPLNLFADDTADDTADNTEGIKPIDWNSSGAGSSKESKEQKSLVSDFLASRAGKVKSDSSSNKNWILESTSDNMSNPFLNPETQSGGEEAFLQHQKSTEDDVPLTDDAHEIIPDNALPPDFEPLEDDDDDDSPPSSPTRGAMKRQATRGLSTSSLMRQMSDIDIHGSSGKKFTFLDKLKSADDDAGEIDSETKDQSASHIRWPLSPSLPQQQSSVSSTQHEDSDAFEESSTSADIQLEYSPSPSPSSTPQKTVHQDDEIMDTTPVHTPIRGQSSNEHTPFPSTPPSAVRMALSRLSAQKIQGLPDLLQSPGTPLTTPNRPKISLPLFDQEDDLEFKQNDTEENKTTEAVSNDKPGEQEKSASETNASRRLSAPAGGLSHSPVLSSLRGVFRTPQKVVETCFAGFAGIRNFMSPSRSPSQRLLTETVKENNVSNKDAVEVNTPVPETQDCHMKSEDLIENKENVFVGEGEDISTTMTTTTTAPSKTLAGTPKGRFSSSHQDALSILLGHPHTPSPKSKEFNFAKEPPFLSPAKPLDQIKARGRLSDIFPQKRTIASHKSQSQGGQNPEDHNGQEIVKDVNGTTMRRRTISLLEFKGEGLLSSSLLALRSKESQKPKSDHIVVETEVTGTVVVDEEDSGQAELLRILGEGADSSNEEDEDEDEVMEFEENKENIQYDLMEDAKVDAYLYGDDEEMTAGQDLLKTPPRQSSFLSDYSNNNKSSMESTPTSKRRLSFRKRLGSSSPGFRVYEQPNGGSDEEEEDEDDMVVMISPKRVRVRNFLGGSD